MDHELLRAIRDDPTNEELRIALADLWRGTPEAGLVRILMKTPGDASTGRIRRWCKLHLGWPGRVTELTCDCVTKSKMSVPDGWEPDNWLYRAFDPDLWPREGDWRDGVVALARRQRRNAWEWPIDEPIRGWLDMIADGPFPSTSVSVRGPKAFSTAHRSKHHLAGMTIERSQWVSLVMDSSPFDIGRAVEHDDQYHVFGWSWLGLPPLEPEAPPVPQWDAPPVPPGPPVKKSSEDDWPDGGIVPGGFFRALWGRFFG